MYRQNPCFLKKSKKDCKKNFKKKVLPRKDILRNQKISESVLNVQSVSNPNVKQSKVICNEITNHQIIDDVSAVYKERVISFGREKITGKIK